MIDSVLIANRGEIACRVIRTLKQQGIRAIAVYSEADATAQHVTLADDAMPVGEAHPTKSYLNIDAILQAAQKSGAKAIHPGYGFLSENAEFARRVLDAGLVWIGPSPDAIIAMGDKQSARRLMAEAGVPIVPGADTESLDKALPAAEEIGYPVMIKAAHGGGGIGMHAVQNADELQAAWETAQTRAERSFGNGTLYLEKCIEDARHIEIQLFGDQHGNLVHMFERECSVQRRHQKVVEEALSPSLSAATRDAMTEAALNGAASINYCGAGTMEFLVDRMQHFYFLEMNTRLQVEHPVTEQITGLDLVAWQLDVAADKPLPLVQTQIGHTGHAIECRIYAENPKKFLPSPGTIETLVWPQHADIRIETGVRQGDTITPFYDPMIAKIVATADSRDEAVARMTDALEQTTIEGIKTNIPFLLEVMADPEFRMGNYTTGLIKKLRPKL